METLKTSPENPLPGYYGSLALKKHKLSAEEEEIFSEVIKNIPNHRGIYDPMPLIAGKSAPRFAGDPLYQNAALTATGDGDVITHEMHRQNRQSHAAALRAYIPKSAYSKYLRYYLNHDQLSDLSNKKQHSDKLKPEEKEFVYRYAGKPTIEHRVDNVIDKINPSIIKKRTYKHDSYSFTGALEKQDNKVFTEAEMNFAKEFAQRFPETLVATAVLRDSFLTYLEKFHTLLRQRHPSSVDDHKAGYISPPAGVEPEKTKPAIARLYELFTATPEFYDSLLVALARRYFINHGGVFNKKEPDWNPPTLDDYTQAFQECIDAPIFRAKIRSKKVDLKGKYRSEEKFVHRVVNGHDIADPVPLDTGIKLKRTVETGIDIINDGLTFMMDVLGFAEYVHPGRVQFESICPGSAFLIGVSTLSLHPEKKDSVAKPGTLFYDLYRDIKDRFKVEKPEQYERIKDSLLKEFGLDKPVTSHGKSNSR